MTAERITETALAEAQAAHVQIAGPLSESWRCSCGDRSTTNAFHDGNPATRQERAEEYRAHQRTVLLPLFAAHAEAVLAEAAAALRALGRGCSPEYADWLAERAQQEGGGQ